MTDRDHLSAAKQALIEQRLRMAAFAGTPRSAIPLRPHRDWAPLSFMQHQMFVIDQLTPGNPAYNMPYGYRLRGSLDPAALEAAFNAVIKRHEVLRTTFAVREGEPIQLIHPALEVALAIVRLDHLPQPEREQTLHRLATGESVRPFDLARLPLIRATLFRLAPAEHVLIINLHHIVGDGLSTGPLLAELDTFYRAFTEARNPQPPALVVQYGDFASWQRGRLADAAVLDPQLAFWRERLEGPLPVLDLPRDRSRPATQSFRGSNVFFDLPEPIAREARALGERHGCTFFMTMLAAFQVLLQRYSGADDLIIGAPVSLRSTREFDPLIGVFLNMAALRCDLSGDPTFVELLRRTRDTALDAFSNGDLPLETLVRHVRFERDPSRNAIFQVALQLMSQPTPHLGDLAVESFPFDLGFAQFDLTLHLHDEAGSYRGRLEYCSDLFDASTMKRLAGHFTTLLAAVVENPDRRISRLPLLTCAERREALTRWNRAEIHPHGLCLHERFEQQAALRPDAVAVACEEEHVSYATLNARANRLAHRLRELGVGPDVLVGLRVERSVDLVVGILGILKAGGAYLPLDPQYPHDRVAFMLEDSRVSVVVTQRALAEDLADLAVVRLLLDEPWEGPESNPPALATADNLAYVIYTSGSTGTPKGVMVTHYNVARLFEATHAWYGFDERDVWTLFHSYAFDFSVWELWGALLHGGRLLIVPYLVSRSPKAFRDLLLREHVTVLNQTPTAFSHLVQVELALPRADFALRYVIFGGEALELRSLRPWFERYGDGRPQLVNMYGITETTVHVTYRPIGMKDLEAGRGSVIGEALPDLQLYILDAAQEPVPIGVPGELYVGGAGVARGYLNRPELTAERFVADRLGVTPGRKLYRSGDRGRRLADGDIEYLGRVDQQVKIRGFRVEPGEIEAAIARHPAVREVAVVVREDSPGAQRLVAYVVADGGPVDIAGELRTRLRAMMPAYMVPAAFVLVEAFPLTPNGKIDRARLPAPERSPVARGADVAPRTATEELVMGVFREVLGRTDFGVFETFFDLGGDSLMAARMMLRLLAASGYDVPLRVLFERQTVAAMSEAIDALAWVAGTSEARAPAGARVEIEL